MTPTTIPPRLEPKFACSICGESSEKICTYCTKDCCQNHLCDRCGRCSDCCVCDLKQKRAG